MTPFYKKIIIATVSALFFISCDDEYGAKKESVPVIESAAITETITFGSSVTLTATITDPATTLTTLSYDIQDNGKTIISGDIPITGSSAEVSQEILVPLLRNQSDNAQLKVLLTARNILKGISSKELTATGKRPVFSRLYLVTDDNEVITLNSGSGGNIFQASGLLLESTFRFKIAEKLTGNGQIDYSGIVWGNVNGKLGMIDEKGESAFIHALNSDYANGITYNLQTYEVSISGAVAGEYDLLLSAFTGDNINAETYNTLTLTLENNMEYTLLGSLGDAQIVYNLDFFERTSVSKIKFLGKTGTYTLYYNPVRKNVFVGRQSPAYPDYLLTCGSGIGYPTKVSNQEIAAVYSGHGIAHSGWGFNITQFILFREISANVYQGTFFVSNGAGFKPFENSGWGNEKKAGDFTFTGEDIISGDNDWNAGESVEGNYRFTIDLSAKTVKIEKITL